jgi:DNA-binding response OmpR family regulator
MKKHKESNGIKVLVVEDDRETSFHMCRMLTDLGYTVFAAYDLQEALDKFNKENPDICVIDVYLRFLTLEESGIDFFRAAQKSGKKFKSIIVSGCCNDELQEEIRNMPIDIFMPKPLDTDEFRAAVNKMAKEVKKSANT